ncbi:MAG: Hint domain-containing protein [Gemmobacter sp.]
MTGWIALAGRARSAEAQSAGAQSAGAGPVVLVLEVALPLRGPVVLLDARGTDGRGPGEAALSVFADPGAGVSVLCRRGPAVARLRLPGPLDLPATGVLRLSLCWGGPGPGWSLRAEGLAAGLSRMVRGRGGLPLPPQVMAGMLASTGDLRCDGAVLWVGLAAGERMPVPAPWIGPATPVDTPNGPREVASLRVGDAVCTLAGVRMLAGVEQNDTPMSGSLTPVRLRAPWFARGADLIVSSDQPVVLSGVSVEYLFGEDAVLAEAGHLAGHESARRDPRAGMMQGVSLHIDGTEEPGAAVILADGCTLAVGGVQHLRWLEAWEALPLRLHLGPGLRARAA